MSVVFVHYHLSRGGVTRVVESASRCLTAAGVPHVILTGSSPDGPTDLPVRVIDGLGYLSDGAGRTPLRLVHAMRAAVQEAIGFDAPVWHFHNHSLGVNPLMAEVVGILAEAGEKIVLQIHDLAEDGRPNNYPMIANCDILYPVAPQIRYAFLNSHDQANFHRAGLPPECSMVLPNPITPPAQPTGSPPADAPTLVLYPVRGIRRKNLGELFLLSALASDHARFALTLEPVHPRWKPFFEDWRAFASDAGLPVELGVVGRVGPDGEPHGTFESWLGRATHLITTSIAEGFGLGFLESAALGKPLFGRNLAHLTQDYVAAGITAGKLYDRLLVPESWVGRETLRQRLTRCLQDVLDAYDSCVTAETIDRVYDALRFQGRLDFGNLPEDLQRQVIRRVLDGKDLDAVQVEVHGASYSARAWLEETLASREPTASADQLAPYSLDRYRQRLCDLYGDLENTPAAPPVFLHKHLVLQEYLKPEHFNFLLT